jgi:murein DD-endopeptidase MepM/ murein hydrolase activator NlpD
VTPFAVKRLCVAFLLFVTGMSSLAAAPPAPTRGPTLRVVDLTVGESQDVTLADGVTVRVKLLELQEARDTINRAVRLARVKVEVDGRAVVLESANYRLPTTVGRVQIDCSITKGYVTNSNRDMWNLEKDARLRLWPAGSPWIEPGTFVYPLKQRWFASGTQMANEPVHVNDGESPANKSIYYHNDLDFGGCEGMVDVIAATDGLVVSARTELLAGFQGTPARPRYDVVYLLDDRGWYYRYSHLHTIEDAIRPGARVKMGQKLGVLGKEGASGGWAHLHFGIVSRQPSGKWGTQEAYAFAWEAYLREHQPAILAVARPHHVSWVGEPVTLDGTRSWSRAGKIDRHEWTFTDGTTAVGASVQRRYGKPGTYSEVLKVTGADGAVGYDFAVVQVLDPAATGQLPPSIQAAYAPSLGVKAGQRVTFKVRTFRTTHGEETWNFGDGTPPVSVKSDGNVKALAKDGFAITEHRFARAGDYLVRVERRNERDEPAIAHLSVRVEP